MSAPTLHRIRRIVIWLGLDLALAAGLLGFTVWADSPAKFRQAPMDGCYCGCAASKTSAGCGKMCELTKYASRHWAITCAKPHATTPAQKSGAGPRFPRPGRSERASN